jgi:hypothetical protein
VLTALLSALQCEIPAQKAQEISGEFVQVAQLKTKVQIAAASRMISEFITIGGL